MWASASSADRETIEDTGGTRADGWVVAYEQIGSGKQPERTVFNELELRVSRLPVID